MELKVNEIQALEPIKFNYDDLKEALTKKASEYKSVVYTEETIQTAKADRALLNKLSTTINDERKRVVKELRDIYKIDEFESKCKELTAIVDDASGTIDAQIKAFENAEKDNKMQTILAKWMEIAGEYGAAIDFSLVMDESWLNKTTSMKKIEGDLSHIISKTKSDMDVLDQAIEDEKTRILLKDFYFKNINSPSVLSLTMQEAKRLQESTQKLENITKTEEKVTQEPEKVTENEQLMQLVFKAYVTREQALKLKEFMKANNIKGEMIKM